MIKAFFALAATMLLVGCEPNINLTHERAKYLLDSYHSFYSQIGLALTPSLVEAGVRSGLFIKVHDPWEHIELTSLGSHYFQSVQADSVLRQPLERQVTLVSHITSLERNSSIKRVHFSWRYKSVPEALAPLVINNGEPHWGHVHMRLKRGYWQIIESSLLVCPDNRSESCHTGSTYKKPPNLAAPADRKALLSDR
jgi:hypothetical protein